MKAKEFYELNKGKYFMYGNQKVRVVGFGPSHVVISTKKRGIEFSTIDNIDRSLLHDGEKGLYVFIVSLKPIEQQNINLCEILKGCEGMELWCDLFGKCRLLNTKGRNSPYKIEVELIDKDFDEDGIECFSSDGKFYPEYPNAKCILWPSETNRNWSTFVNPITGKEGAPVMTKWNSAAFWKLESYTKDNKSDFIVPVSDFDFSDFDSNKSKSIV